LEYSKEELMMAENRDRAIMVNIEPTFHEIVKALADKENTSVSNYCRSLIIQDLVNKGLVTDRMVAEVLIG
jgi:hypothetical protein